MTRQHQRDRFPDFHDHAKLDTLSPLAGSREDYEAEVVLRDGSTVRVRAVRPGDEPPLLEFLRDLSQPSRTLRFGGGISDYFLRQAAGRLARDDKEHALGLIAMSGPDQRIIGHAMYAVTGPDRAEVAFAIADACQHQGLGTILLGELAQVASSRGIRVFEAIVLPRNHQMVAVFRDSGFPVQIHAAPDEILIEFPTELTEKALEHFEQREWTAAVNAVHAFFRPRSVAVVGASRHRGTIGGEVFHNLVSYEFRGPVFPVNPAAPVVQDVVAYPSVEEIPGPVDLAVVVVPAERVSGVVQARGRKRVRALVVLSAGFAETGPEGRAKQQALVDTAHAAPGRDPDRSARSQRRRARSHLYSTPRHPAGGRGARDCRGGAGAGPRTAGGRCVHAVPRSASGAPSSGSTHSVLRFPGGCGDCPRPGRLVRRMAHATPSATGPAWRRATG